MPIATSSPDPQSKDVWVDLYQRILRYQPKNPETPKNIHDLDQFLIQKVEAIVQSKDDEARAIAIDQFLKSIHILPNLHKPKESRFSGIYDRLLKDKILPAVKHRIHEFYPTGHSLALTLGKWVNEKLRLHYAMLDEYRAHRIPETSFDHGLNGYDDHMAFQAFKTNPTLQGLDHLIATEQAQNTVRQIFSTPFLNETLNSMTTTIITVLGHSPAMKFRDYVTTDPDGELTDQYVGKTPECTYQIVLEALWIKDPPQTKKAIAQQFGIPYQAFYAHYTRHIDPNLIHRLFLEKGWLTDEAQAQLRHHFDNDSKQHLQQCHPKKAPIPNAHTLAQNRFHWYGKMQSFEAIASDHILNPDGLTTKKLEKFWIKEACPFIAQHALQLLVYHPDINTNNVNDTNRSVTAIAFP